MDDVTSSSELLFGVYAASQVSTIVGPPDDRAAVGDLIRRLQGDAPFVVREYLHYLGTPPDPERAAVLHPDRVYGELTMPDQWYLDGHRQLDLVLSYLPVEADVAGWLRFIDRAIDRYGEMARYLQITLEPNFDMPGIDGSSPGVVEALIQGIAHARKTLDTVGLERVRIGFSVAEPQEWQGGDDAFWDRLATVPNAEFADLVDYVGLALYPDAFSPVAPNGTPGDVASLVERGIAHLRAVSLTKAGIGSHVPIHIAECGSITGAERSQEQQAESIEHMVRAVVAVRERFHVRHFELFALRDADSARTEPHAQLGITTSSYQPKAAFETYRELVAEFSA